MLEIKGETSVVIAAPAGSIYDYLADFTRHPEWVKNVSRVEPLTPGPVRVGSKFKTSEGTPPVPLGRYVRSTARFIQGLLTGTQPYSVAEVSALEPGRRLAWVGRLSRRQGEFNRAEWEIVLQPQGSATLVTQRFNYQPQTATAQAMVSALGGPAGIAAACAISLGQLKHRLEAQTAPSLTQPA
jgi:hypothetical protein